MSKEILSYERWKAINESGKVWITRSPGDRMDAGLEIANGLIKRGFSKEEAAAIAGNAWAESQFKPDAVNSIGATGILQWLGPRKKNLKTFAKTNSKSEFDLSVQLDFIKHEITDVKYERVMFNRAMKLGKTVKDKAYYFAKLSERPSAGELAGSKAKREGAAEEIYANI